MANHTVSGLLERRYVDKTCWDLARKPMFGRALVVIRGAQKKRLIPKKPFNNVCHA